MFGVICISGLRQILPQLTTATNNCMWNILTSAVPLFTYDYIYSPGQLFALCFTSENKITGLLLVTYKYRGEIVVKLKENKRKKKKFWLSKMPWVRILSGNRFQLLLLMVFLFVVVAFFSLLSTPLSYCISPERNSVVWKRLGHWDPVYMEWGTPV